MPKREHEIYFTLEEVNALVPQLESHLQHFWSFRQNAQNILEEIQRARKKNLNPMPDEIAHIQLRQSQAHFLIEQGNKELEAVMELGGVIKDHDLGLVDFPHMQDFEEQEVYLCWKYGEKKVRFWHRIDEGYNSRKPVLKRVHH